MSVAQRDSSRPPASPIVLAALLVVACSAVESRAQAPLDAPFELEEGQAKPVRGESLVIRLDAVTGDSRCPLDTTCVWQGNASVRLILQRPRSPEVELVLNTHGGERFPSEACLGERRLRLLDLSPHPTTERREGSALRYTATLLVQSSCAKQKHDEKGQA